MNGSQLVTWGQTLQGGEQGRQWISGKLDSERSPGVTAGTQIGPTPFGFWIDIVG